MNIESNLNESYGGRGLTSGDFDEYIRNYAKENQDKLINKIVEEEISQYDEEDLRDIYNLPKETTLEEIEKAIRKKYEDIDEVVEYYGGYDDFYYLEEVQDRIIEEFDNELEDFEDWIEKEIERQGIEELDYIQEESHSISSGLARSNYFMVRLVADIDEDGIETFEDILKIRFGDGHDNGINDENIDIDFREYKEDREKYRNQVKELLRKRLKEYGYKLKENYSRHQIQEEKLTEAKEDWEKFKIYLQNNTDKREEEIEEIIDTFQKNKQRLKPQERDIYYWLKKPVEELIDTLDNLQTTQTRSEKEKEAKEGAKLLYSDKDWKVYEITTYEASAKYGKNTKWCITGSKRWSNDGNGEKYFNEYTKDYKVKFYFFINSDGKKYALAVYPNKRFEIYNDEDITIPYIPNAPQIDKIGVKYTKENMNPKDIVIDAIIHNRIPFDKFAKIVSNSYNTYINRDYYLDLYDDVEDFAQAIDGYIPNGYLESESVQNGDITPEEFEKITGYEWDGYWGGDYPTIDVYNIFPLSEFDLTTKETLINSIKQNPEYKQGYFIYTDDGNAFNAEITHYKDYSELLLALREIFKDLPDNDDNEEHIDNEMGDADLWLFIKLIADEILYYSGDKELLREIGLDEKQIKQAYIFDFTED